MEKKVSQTRQRKRNFFPKRTHMNKITACIFPETLPDEGLLFPLVQVFETLVHLQTIENDPRPEPESPFIQELRRRQELLGFTSVPLGGQREHFLTLARDIATRGHDYITQLGMLTLADMNPRKATESKSSIIATLMRSNDTPERKDEEEILLWQARLVLKLGELFDRDQKALSKALQGIDARQDALLAELREDTDSLFSYPTNTRTIAREADGTLRHRLRAWSRLFFHHPSPLEQPQIFVTSHDEAMAILQEIYEKNHGQPPEQVLILDLPAASGPWSMDLPVSKRLLENCPELRTTLEALVTTVHGGAEQGGNLHSEHQWQQQCEIQFPAEHYGRTRLELYLFPGIAPERLFLESFAGGAAGENDRKTTAFPGTIVGLLKV